MYKASPPRLEVVSAVGSGDSFAAGMAFSLAGAPDDLEGAVRFAMACGGANALNDGAGYLSQEQINAVSGKIVTVKMA
jgi:fructose-1-phosphate kinase PfkB-like protein